MGTAKFDLSEARTSVDPDRGVARGGVESLSAADSGDVGDFQKTWTPVT